MPQYQFVCFCSHGVVCRRRCQVVGRWQRKDPRCAETVIIIVMLLEMAAAQRCQVTAVVAGSFHRCCRVVGNGGSAKIPRDRHCQWLCCCCRVVGNGGNRRSQVIAIVAGSFVAIVASLQTSAVAGSVVVIVASWDTVAVQKIPGDRRCHWLCRRHCHVV